MAQVQWNVEHLDSVDSTNTWLVRRAREGSRAGTVVVADYQSAGRGRRDRHWSAPAGSSLLCSVLLESSSHVDAPQMFVVAAALSMVDALDTLTGQRPSLKWPNDILYGDAKVAGLLGEVVDGHVVIGLGLNLDAVDPAFTAATTVRAATGVTLAASQVLAVYLAALALRVERLDSPGGVLSLRDDFVANLSTMGRWVRAELANDVVRGRAVGVDDAGALLIETPEDVRVVSAGDVVHLRGEDMP